MILELDYDNKTIAVKGSVNLNTFFKEIKRVVGDDYCKWTMIPEQSEYKITPEVDFSEVYYNTSNKQELPAVLL